MFYDKEQIDDLLKCPSCNERYFEPKSLPCGEILCNSCILYLLDDKRKGIDCPNCLEFHLSPKKDGFPDNKKITRMLEIKSNEVYRSETVDKFKSQLDKIKFEAKSLVENLNNSSDRVKEFCAFVRDDVQLVKESTIEFITKYTEEFMAEIDKYERECLENLKNKELNQEIYKFHREAENFCTKWLKYLGNFKIKDDEISEASVQASSMIKDLTKIERELKYFTFNGKMIHFDVNLKQVTSDILGTIRYNQISKIFFKPINFNVMKQIQIKNVIQESFSPNQVSIIQLNKNLFAVAYVNATNYQNHYLNVYFVDQTGALINSSTNIKLSPNGRFSNQQNAQYIQLKVSHYNMNIVVFAYSQCPTNGYVYRQLITFEYPSLKINQINERNNSNLSFITCNSSSIYCVHPYQFTIDVYDWNLTLIKTIGQSSNQNSPFYIPQITQLLVNEKEIFVIDNTNSLSLIDKNTGDLIKKLQIKDNNFIVYKENLIISFNESTKLISIFDYVDEKNEENQIEECNTNITLVNKSNNDDLLFLDRQNLIAYSYLSGD